jgi:hypothetical protein
LDWAKRWSPNLWDGWYFAKPGARRKERGLRGEREEEIEEKKTIQKRLQKRRYLFPRLRKHCPDADA